MSQVDVGDWSPVRETMDDVVTAGAAAALHGLLDAPGPPPADGEPLPPLWHWLAFLPRVPQAELGTDGHPRRGTFLPPIALPRRMFVGATVRIRPAARPPGPGAGTGGLLVGEPLRRHGIVEDVRATSGRSGELVFVTVRYDVVGGTATVSETQDLVYRPAAPRPAVPAPAANRGAPAARRAVPAANREAPAANPEAPAANPDASAGAAGEGPLDSSWTMRLDLAVEPTLLFRFSALTYNAHRIHYDRRWATDNEGYPGLVVHGPLQAIGLAELCRRHSGRRVMRSFRFRATSPAFDDGPLLLRGRSDPAGDRAILVAFDHRGTQTMTAEAELD